MMCHFKKYISFLSILLFGSAICVAQDINSPSSTPKKKSLWDWNKVYYGGGLGGGIAPALIAIDISPSMGYKITDKFSAGVGLVYNYFENRQYKPSSKINIYGGSVFTRLFITDFLFAHAELQPLNGPWRGSHFQRFFIYNVWAGGGYRQAAGNNASLMLSILWNLNENIYSYPLSPQIRVGVNFRM